MFESDRDVLDWLTARVEEFVGLLERKHGADPRAQALFAKLGDVRLLADCESVPDRGSWKNGKFKHSTGVLYVAPRDVTGALRTESSLLKTVVHELAHATRFKQPLEAAHSPAWKQTWLWFLKLATEELGWRVDIKCAECSFYGLCASDARAQCPKCNWMQNLCRPYTGRPK